MYNHTLARRNVCEYAVICDAFPVEERKYCTILEIFITNDEDSEVLVHIYTVELSTLNSQAMVPGRFKDTRISKLLDEQQLQLSSFVLC